MGKFTVIPKDTFDALQLDAGVLLKRFNPNNPVAPADADIICATTGGVNPTCVPTYSDLGEDVDNVPANMKELKKCESWDCKIATTGLGTSAELIRLALGCADINAETGAIIPRKDLKQDDFEDSIWWVGDKANGGCVAIELKHALSTAGFSLQTTKNGKGQVKIELTGHVSIDAQDVVPMEFYSLDPAEPVPSVTLNKSAVELVPEGTETLTAVTVPSGETVTWTTSDSDVATVADGVVTAVAQGTATITASITVDGTSYTDTCAVTVSAGA
jgi:hypothetical protein